MPVKYFLVFLVSMVPLIELRGGIPIAMGLGIDAIPAIGICAIGNLVPVPFIYFFARKFLIWGSDKKFIGGMCRFFHDKGERAGQKLSAKTGRYGLIVALMLFVGIPLPGTGAWTGTLGASFLGMGPRQTAAAVGAGVAMASLIMVVLSSLSIHAFGL